MKRIFTTLAVLAAAAIAAPSAAQDTLIAVTPDGQVLTLQRVSDPPLTGRELIEQAYAVSQARNFRYPYYRREDTTALGYLVRTLDRVDLHTPGPILDRELQLLCQAIGDDEKLMIPIEGDFNFIRFGRPEWEVAPDSFALASEARNNAMLLDYLQRKATGKVEHRYYFLAVPWNVAPFSDHDHYTFPPCDRR